MNDREPEVRAPERAGQMTQVMRVAARAAAPKVLRIALLHQGVIVDEQVAAAGATITVGPTERATFVVASSALAPSHPLFEPKGGSYRLNLLAGMTARVATRAGVVDLGGRSQELAIAPDARGKVVVGDATFLFQFVDEKPAQPKVPLPMAARMSLTSEIDWMTTIVAALSFLLHFGLVASLYGDWLDPTVDDSVVVGQVVDVVRALPSVPAVERQDGPAERPVATSNVEVRAPSTGGSPGDRAPGAKKGPGSEKMSDAAATKLSTTLDALNVAMMGVLNGKGPSTAVVLQTGGDLPTGLVDQAAKSEVGVGRGGVAGLDTGHGGSGPVRPGAHAGSGLDRIGVTQGTAPTSAGSANAAPRPKGFAQIAPPEPGGGEVPGAGGVVAGLAGGFRHCYNDALANEDPTMQGSMRVVARIGPNGDVIGTSTKAGGGSLSGGVMGCVAAKVAGARFSAPLGGLGATLVIPVTFLLPK